jgi:hypothetical protein
MTFPRCGALPVQPSMLGGQFSVLISEVHFRNATRSSSCWSVKLNCGIWRRPGTLVGCALIQTLMKARAAPFVDVAQFRRKVGALAQQGMAADAIAGFPQMLAARDLRRQIFAVIALGQLPGSVKSEREKQQHRKQRAAVEDVSRHGFGEKLRS